MATQPMPQPQAGDGSSTSPSSETVSLKLPSGELVDAMVPTGLSDSQISLLMKMKRPDLMVNDPKKTMPMREMAQQSMIGGRTNYMIGGEPIQSMGQQAQVMGQGMATDAKQLSTPGVAATILKKQHPELSSNIEALMNTTAASPEELVTKAMTTLLPMAAGGMDAPETVPEAKAVPQAAPAAAPVSAPVSPTPQVGPGRMSVPPWLSAQSRARAYAANAETPAPPPGAAIEPNLNYKLPNVFSAESAARYQLSSYPLSRLQSLAAKRGIDFTVGQPGLQRFLVEKLVRSLTDNEIKEFSAQATEKVGSR